MAKDKDKKILLLGKVVKVEASGMVLLDTGSRSNTKAEVGDTLKRDKETGEIIVEKGNPFDNTSSIEIVELTKENSVLNAQVDELKAELLEKDEAIKVLNTNVAECRAEIERLNSIGGK